MSQAFGRWVTRERTACVLSRRDLAHRLHISERTVYRWERGESEPHPHVRRAIAQLFEMLKRMRNKKRSAA